MRLLPLLAVLAGCPKPPPTALPEGPIRLTVTQVPFKDLCISPVAGAGPIKGKDAPHVDRAITFLSEGRFNFALTALAQTTEAHPAVDALRAATMVLMGKHDEAGLIHTRLLAENPEDACLFMAGALNSAVSGNLEEAGTRARTAWDLDRTDADAALLWASFTGTSDPKTAAAALDEVYTAFPDHPGAAWLAGIARLDQGDNDGAMAAFEVARQGGMPVDEFLMELHFQMGDTGAYIQAAAGIPSLPVIDRDAIRKAEDPRAAFLSALGMVENDQLYAVLETSMGELECRLFPEIAPVTVSNFVGLATGKLPWTQPESGEPGVGPLYDGVVFHRVIPEFMVQVGDPLGNGTGGPGYRFKDEVRGAVVFNEPGLLAMANAGPGTNGSQFFITEVPVPHLNGKHTIFGGCDDAALEKVKAIARVPADNTRPVEPVVLQHVRIEARP